MEKRWERWAIVPFQVLWVLGLTVLVGGILGAALVVGLEALAG